MARVKVTLPATSTCQHVELEMTHGPLIKRQTVLLSSLTQAQNEDMIFDAILMNVKTFCVLSKIQDLNELKSAVEAKEFKI